MTYICGAGGLISTAHDFMNFETMLLNGGVFNDIIGATKPLGTGWIGVIKADGNWVVHSDASLLGQPVTDQQTLDAIAGAAAGNYHATSSVAGDNWRVAALKVELKQFGIAWTVITAGLQEQARATS